MPNGHMSRSPLLVAGALELCDKMVGPLRRMAGHRYLFPRLEPSFEAAGVCRAADTRVTRRYDRGLTVSPKIGSRSRPCLSRLAAWRHAGPGAGRSPLVPVWVVVA